MLPHTLSHFFKKAQKIMTGELSKQTTKHRHVFTILSKHVSPG